MSFASVDNSAGLLHNGGQMAWDAVSPGHIVMATITADYKLLVQEINFSGGNTVIGKASFVKQLSGWTGAADLVHFRPRIFSLGDGKILVLAPSSYMFNSGLNPSSGYKFYVTGTSTGLTLAASQSSNAIAPLRYSFITMARDTDGNYKITGSIDLDTADPLSLGDTTRGWCSTFNPLELFSKSGTSIEFRRNYLPYTSTATVSYYRKITLSIVNGVITDGTVATTNGGASISPSYALYDVRYVLDREGKPVKIYTVGSRGESGWLGYNASLYLFTQWYDSAFPAGIIASRDGYSTSVPMGPYLGPCNYAPMDQNGVNCYMIGNNVGGANQSVNGNQSSAGQVIFQAFDTAWVTSSVVCILTCPTLSAYYTTLDADITAAIRAKSYGGVIPLALSFREIAGAGTYVGPVDAIPTPYFMEQFKNVGNIIHRIDDTHFWLVGCFKADVNSDSKLGVITVSI